MADVFISYKREERERVLPIARAIESIGYTCWWDLDLVAGELWKRRIKEQLDLAKCVLVTWTTKTVGEDGLYASEWVEREASEGNRRKILIPVLLDLGRIAWEHDHIQHADLTAWSGAVAGGPGWLMLRASIAKLAGTRVPPEPAELAAWSRAEEDASLGALENFASSHPKSRFARVAESMLADEDGATSSADFKFGTRSKAENEALKATSSRKFQRSTIGRDGDTPNTMSMDEFIALGLDVNAVGLEFFDVSVERAFDGPTPLLLVSGEVRNVGREKRVVPPVRISLRDSRAREVLYVIELLAEGALPPGDAVSFTVQVADPPSDAVEIEAEFADFSELHEFLSGRISSGAGR